LVGWSYMLFYETHAPEIASKAIGLVRGLLPFWGEFGALLGAMVIALGLSMIAAVFDGIYFEWLNRRGDSPPPAWLQIGRHCLVAGLTGGLPVLVIFTASPNSLWVALYCGVLC